MSTKPVRSNDATTGVARVDADVCSKANAIL